MPQLEAFRMRIRVVLQFVPHENVIVRLVTKSLKTLDGRAKSQGTMDVPVDKGYTGVVLIVR